MCIIDSDIHFNRMMEEPVLWMYFRCCRYNNNLLWCCKYWSGYQNKISRSHQWCKTSLLINTLCSEVYVWTKLNNSFSTLKWIEEMETLKNGHKHKKIYVKTFWQLKSIKLKLISWKTLAVICVNKLNSILVKVH